jgi:hypothetical protein
MRKVCRQHAPKKQRNRNNEAAKDTTMQNDDEIQDIDDSRVPDIVREHGSRFRLPARYAVLLGNDEFALYAENGELLDLVYLK